MDTNEDKLILPDGSEHQLSFFEKPAEAEKILMESERATGVFTGEKLKAGKPEKYALIIELLAQGLSVNRISQLVKSSRNLISVVLQSESIQIEQLKKRLGRQFYDLARLGNNKIFELLADPDYKPPLKDLIILSGTAFDKGQLADGAPTMITGTVDGESHSDLIDYLEGLRAQAGKAIGYSGENSEQKEIDITDQVEASESPANQPPIDLQSSSNSQNTEETSTAGKD